MPLLALVGDKEGAVPVEGEPGRDAAGVEVIRGDPIRRQPDDRAVQPVDEEKIALPIEGRPLGRVVAGDQQRNRRNLAHGPSSGAWSTTTRSAPRARRAASPRSEWTATNDDPYCRSPARR